MELGDDFEDFMTLYDFIWETYLNDGGMNIDYPQLEALRKCHSENWPYKK
jgi:hypothetical protein